MAESKYEKYVCRNPLRPHEYYREHLAKSETMPPMVFSNGNNPIEGSNQFIEALWVWSDCIIGADPKEPHLHPHSHTFDEMFLWLGSNPEDPSDLGAEVEFWLGDEGEKRDKVTFDTSTLIFVPAGLRHLPIVYKRVKRPLMHMAIGINSGEYKMLN